MASYDFSMLKPIKGRKITDALDDIYKSTPDLVTARMATALRDSISPEDDLTEGLTEDEIFADAARKAQKANPPVAGTNGLDKLVNLMDFTPERAVQARGKLEPLIQASYETKLTPAQERAFALWKKENAPNDSGQDYDLRGAFKAGLTPLNDPTSPDHGHWPDTYKKPSHPTFSDQSVYAKGNEKFAGRWEGDTFVPPEKKWNVPAGAILPIKRENGELKLATPGIVKSLIEGVKAPGQALKGELTDIDEMRSKSWDTLGLMGGGGVAFTPKGALGATGSKAFYSQLEDFLEKTPTKETTVGTWKNLMQKAGVKPEEIKQRLGTFFGGAKDSDKVNKAVMQEELSDPVLKENWFIDNTSDPDNYSSPKHASWTLPGGKDYKELVLSEPGATYPKHTHARIVEENGTYKVAEYGPDAKGQQKFHGYVSGGYLTREAAERQAQKYADEYGVPVHKETPKFKHQGHWGNLENPLVHIRMNDRIDADGKKVLHIEEVQSDWAQKGRKEGFADPNSPEVKKLQTKLEEVKRVEEEVNKARQAWKAQLDADQPFNDGFRNMKANHPDFDKEYDAWKLRASKRNELWDVIVKARDKEKALLDTHGTRFSIQHQIDKLTEGIPKAPFIENTSDWVTLAMKRIMKHAADNGYDRISWTTGEQQIERYVGALRKQVDAIRWEKTQEGVQLVGYKDNKEILNTKVKGENNLSDSIGKAMADQIIKDTKQTGLIEGENITIDKGWPRQHYDRMMVDVANKLGKKHGVRAGQVEFALSTKYYAPREDGGRWYIYDVRNNKRASGGYSTIEEALNRIQTDPAYTNAPNVKVHSLDVSPSMKSPAALFAKGAPVTPTNEKDKKKK